MRVYLTDSAKQASSKTSKACVLTRLCHEYEVCSRIFTQVDLNSAVRIPTIITYNNIILKRKLRKILYLLLELFFLSSPFLCPELPLNKIGQVAALGNFNRSLLTLFTFSSLSSPSLLFLTVTSLPSLSRSWHLNIRRKQANFDMNENCFYPLLLLLG